MTIQYPADDPIVLNSQDYQTNDFFDSIVAIEKEVDFHGELLEDLDYSDGQAVESAYQAKEDYARS